MRGFKKNTLKAVTKDFEEILTIEEEKDSIKAIISDKEFKMDVIKIGEHTYSIIMDGRVYEVQLDEMDRGRYAVYIGDRVTEVNIFHPRILKMEETGVSSKEDIIEVFSPMPGKIVRVFLKEGDKVEKDSPVLTMEAMKMENEIRSPIEGVIKGIFVKSGQIIEGNVLLFKVEK